MPTITENEDRCEACFGLGYVPEMRATTFGQKIQPPTECKACNGTGKKPKQS